MKKDSKIQWEKNKAKLQQILTDSDQHYQEFITATKTIRTIEIVGFWTWLYRGIRTGIWSIYK